MGQFYANKKEIDTPIIVACMNSATLLAIGLSEANLDVLLLISDECHRTETDRFLEAVVGLEPKAQLGFTATPWRSKKTEELSLFDDLICDYGPGEAIRDRIVVPWKIIPWQGAKMSTDDACLAMCLEAKGKGLGPGIVNSKTIASAEEFAHTLSVHGMPAAAIHSGHTACEQDDLLGRLKSGKLDALVHVSLLQEGVDMPWLRWGCLRRPVRSRVRFAQEVGRFLRAHPGKEYATLYDPHDLFGKMKLTYESVLAGGAEDKQESLPIEEAYEDMKGAFLDAKEAATAQSWATAMGMLGAYLRQLVVALSTVGIVNQNVSNGPWRHDPASDKQVQTLTKMKWALSPKTIKNIPQKHSDVLVWCVSLGERLTKGQASDMLSVIFGLKDAGSWPDLATIMANAPDVAK